MDEDPCLTDPWNAVHARNAKQPDGSGTWEWAAANGREPAYTCQDAEALNESKL